MKKLLLHVCCAPCACFPAESLIENYNVSLFYYNPNISPLTEYERRRDELVRYADNTRFLLIIAERDDRSWIHEVKDVAIMGERSERCWICYRIRLEKTFQYAAEHHFDIVGTVLSVSPHKDSSHIREIGIGLSKQYHIDYLDSDFKKNDGYKKSCEKSNNYGFYRQSYCGCVYSMLERKENSGWRRKVREYKMNTGLFK